MKIFKFEDFTNDAQLKILKTQKELDASDQRHIVSHRGNLDLPLKEQNESFPLVKTAIFIVSENEDGSKSYIFSYAEPSQDV